MKIKQNPQGETMVLELSGKIMGGPDHEKFKAEVTDVLEKEFSKVVLDFSGVPWINSTGLGIIISGYHSIKAAERHHEGLLGQGTGAEHLLHLPAGEHFRGVRLPGRGLGQFRLTQDPTCPPLSPPGTPWRAFSWPASDSVPDHHLHF